MEENAQREPQQTGPPPTNTTPQQPEVLTEQSKEMEVHHHAHVHEKMKWKDYLFQFLMLFLAVALGFATEKFREHQIERSMEKEYISSLVSDVNADKALIEVLQDSIYNQAKRIDTLQTLFSDIVTFGEDDATTRKCYLMSACIGTFYPVILNQTTIASLMSTGNLRLIKAENATTDILTYYNMVKTAEEQNNLYRDYINKCLESMYTVYDISLLRTNIARDSLIPPRIPGTHLVTTNVADLKRLSSLMERAKIAAFFLINRISEVRTAGIELLDRLNTAYKK